MAGFLRALIRPSEATSTLFITLARIAKELQPRLKFTNPILQRVFQPLGYMKHKMNLIDDCRKSYENCSSRYETESEMLALLGVERSFETWFSFTVFHIWMMNAKCRTMGGAGGEFSQELFNHIWLDVELKLHHAKVRTNISKINENLVASYYGAVLGYDEGTF